MATRNVGFDTGVSGSFFIGVLLFRPIAVCYGFPVLQGGGDVYQALVAAAAEIKRFVPQLLPEAAVHQYVDVLQEAGMPGAVQ